VKQAICNYIKRMSESEISRLKSAVAPFMMPQEAIIWASPTAPNAQNSALLELRKDVGKNLMIAALIVMATVIAWQIFPDFRDYVMLIGMMLTAQRLFEIVGPIYKYHKLRRLRIGGYALTRKHLYELDTALKIRRKLDASKVRYALDGETGIVIAPLGPHLNDGHQLRWLPDAVTSEQIQAAVDG